MDLVKEYIASIQSAIDAGADVRATINDRDVSIIKVEQGDKCLEVEYLDGGFEAKHAETSLKTDFRVAFNDWPRNVTNAGWW